MSSPITKKYWRRPIRPRLRASVIAVVASSMAIATFGIAGGASATSKPKPKPTITVWVDSTRVPQVKAYEKAHPTVKISMVIYNGNANGSGVLQSKIALDNRVH